jgi:hypothetical protein
MAEEFERNDEPVRRRNYLETGLSAFKRISWGAVFAGLIIALVTQLVLSLLGIGIGMGSIEPLRESNPFTGLGTGALVWWVVSILISLFLGGLTAGRLAGIPRASDSMLHGLLTFSMFTLVMFYLITTTVGSIVSGVGGIVGQTLSYAGQGVAMAANKAAQEITKSGVDLSDIKREANSLLMQTGKPALNPDRLKKQAGQTAQNAAQNPQDAGTDISSMIDQIFNSDKGIDRDAIVNVIVARTNMSHAEAEKAADNWIQTYNNAKAKFDKLKHDAEMQARKTGDVIAASISKAAIFSFIGLLLGAISAAVGGRVGEPGEVVAQQRVNVHEP